MTVLFIVTLVIILLLRSVFKVYKQVPPAELTRQAKKDKYAKNIYEAAQYGIFLDIVVGVLIAILISLNLYSINDISSIWFIVFALVIIGYTFVWPKNNKSLSISKTIAVWLAPFLGGLSRWVSPILSLLLPLTIRQPKSTPMYDSSDLVTFLSEQKSLSNSRISHSQLDELIEVLQKSDHRVQDLMIKRKKMKILKPDDAVGPILLSELHESKQTSFVVEDTEKGIVGTVSLNALSALREGGQVDRIMERELYFVHKDWPLTGVMKGYLETKMNNFLVVDDTEKIVGIITLEQVIDASLEPEGSQKKFNYADITSIATSSK